MRRGRLALKQSLPQILEMRGGGKKNLDRQFAHYINMRAHALRLPKRHICKETPPLTHRPKMAFFHSLLTLLSLISLLSLTYGMKNPCHPYKNQQGKNVGCEVISIPPSLCQSCRLRPFAANGNFNDCSNIYNLDTQTCRDSLVEYAALNPCDTVRNNLVQNLNSGANIKSLDYFVYSVCEECCDCVPMGASVGQYMTRLAAGTLYKSNRGNCPAHAYYDICKVWPQVRYVKKPGEVTPDLSSWPKMCPESKIWRDTPSGQNWYNKAEVSVQPPFAQFLERFVESSCGGADVWNDCTKLEAAQNRL